MDYFLGGNFIFIGNHTNNRSVILKYPSTAQKKGVFVIPWQIAFIRDISVSSQTSVPLIHLDSEESDV